MSDTLKANQTLTKKPPTIEEFYRDKKPATPSELDALHRLMRDLDFSAAKYLHKKRARYLKEHPEETLPELPDYLKLEKYQQKK